LAAANPIGGHYNRAKTVSENLKLGPALLSRFDLVFILIDRPDLLQDSLLSDHVMALHTTSAAGGGLGVGTRVGTGPRDGEEGMGTRQDGDGAGGGTGCGGGRDGMWRGEGRDVAGGGWDGTGS
jgi:hypothetical protein